MMEMRGISPIISAVILIAVIFAIGALVSPWMFNLIRETSNETASSTINEVKCMNAAYDFDTTYRTYGVGWDFSTANNTLGVRIKNTGTISLYNFSFELVINDTIVEYLHAKRSTQRTSSNPLKPGQTAFIDASFDRDINGSLTRLKVMNAVCPNVYAEQEF